MAYFEVGTISADGVELRFRELGEAPSAYNYLHVDFDGLGVPDIMNDIPNSQISFYADTVGYRTNWFTFLQLIPGAEYDIRCYATTNDLYDVNYKTGATHYVITIPDAEPDVPYPVPELESVTTSRIYIYWGEVANATQYYIYVDGVYRGAATDLDYTITGLDPGTTYYITMTAWRDGVESNFGYQVILIATTIADVVAPNYVSASLITTNSVKLSWSGATPGVTFRVRYRAYLTETEMDSSQYVLTNSTNAYYTLTGLLPATKYHIYIGSVRDDGTIEQSMPATGSNEVVFTTLAGSRPTNWAWEYTIASGQPFYTQSGSSVFIMRASHWNDFTARINEFRIYKLGAGNVYSFTTALTSHSPTQIKNCINQAITAINAMGFSQSQITSGGDVAASTFTTMRNNLNSIT